MKERMSLAYWRCVFRCTGTSVFDIIESAIRVAAADRPDELAARRDRITELLYTCRRCHCDRAADEQRESSSGATTQATARTDRTKAEAEADVPAGTPGASFIGKEFDAGGNLAGDSAAAANSEIRNEFDEGSASNPSEEQVPAQLIGRKDTAAKRKREDATYESPEPRDVPNKNPKPASGETTKCQQNQNRGQSHEVLNAPASTTKAATQQHYDDKSLAEKLEALRMRLRDGYQAVLCLSAKKVRTVRVVELHEIPKPNNIRKDSNKNRSKRAVSVRFMR